MDESGLSTVHKPSKIFATRGRKQIGAITSAERGTHTTVVCCMSPTGFRVPPALIFGRKKMKKELFDEAPTGTLELIQESGWMVEKLFLKWLKHVVKYSHASIQNPVLLILDGPASHKYLPALEYAKQNGVILLCLPPHCTHRIQPLDISFIFPLSTYYDQEVSKWMKNHPGRAVTQFQVAKLFASAYEKAASIAIAASGFAKSGIYPLNPDIFPDHLFAPSEVTDIPLSNNEPIPSTFDQKSIEKETTSDSILVDPNKNLIEIKPPPEPTVSFLDVSPIPVATANVNKRKRKKQSA